MLDLLVSKLEVKAHEILGVELRQPGGGALPAFTAGSHIDVFLPGGKVRQYSLCSDPNDRERYCLGVGLAPASRGGSEHIHQRLHVGDTLRVGLPRSLFGVNEQATHHVFIAGGIGITPILSMIRWCEAHQHTWRLLYCVRSRSRAAYLEELASFGEQVVLHIDDEATGGLVDLHGYLSQCPTESNVYCCGPAPLMDAVARTAEFIGVPKSAMHFERFSAMEATAQPASRKEFTVVLCKTGCRLPVPADKSILEVLEENNVFIPYSCREGLCRTCEVNVVSGRPDHLDYVLTDEEREQNKSVLVCVSRALSHELALDV